VDPEAVVSSGAPPNAREELLNLYNLATSLDPALVALTRACPFYEGLAPGLAVRTAFYRGSALFGWEGLYTNLPEVGILRPYARSVQELVEHGFASYRAWLTAMDRAGVERRTFFETGGNVLKASWNPVRLNQHGTVELRGIDGNYPKVVLAVVALVHDAASRVREEGLTVEPNDQTYTFKVDGERLFVPGFDYLGKSLFYAAATIGAEGPEVAAYLDSIVGFAAPEGTGSEYLSSLEPPYKTTEDEILARCPRNILSKDEGLRLVRNSCDELEEQISFLHRKVPEVSTET
jgi:carboxylate-amine ligase